MHVANTCKWAISTTHSVSRHHTFAVLNGEEKTANCNEDSNFCKTLTRDPAWCECGNRSYFQNSDRRTITVKNQIQFSMQTTSAPVNANKALWEKGDFTKLAQTMRESGTALVSQLGIRKGDYVLDLGCGDGTTAIPAAHLGARVRGVDIAENLVAAGNHRVKQEGLTNITFEQGDACNLEALADNTFDFVVSIFGAMFAPKPNDVAKEMIRVTKPGGKIVMGNWIPGDPTLVAQILKISASYTPPPPEGFISPML